MSYAWDMFCPGCSAALVGGMGETDEQMEAEQKSYSGKLVYCSTCEILVDFDSGEEVEVHETISSLLYLITLLWFDQIIEGG